MYKSIIIRHSKTRKPWYTLRYNKLVQLIRQEYDPPIDSKFLKEKIDLGKLKNRKVSLIYSSPSKRAIQTARFISKIIKVPIKIIPELNEIKFEALPYTLYIQGKQKIRDYLFKKSTTKKIKFNKIESIAKENAIIITHGFLMKKIYAKLYNINIGKLKDNDTLTDYISGFDSKSGKLISFISIKN